MHLRHIVYLVALGLVATGCAPYRGAHAPEQAAWPSAERPVRARIRTVSQPLQCVPFARELSGIDIRGNAWTWWNTARGRYRRSRSPGIGSVLVMSKTERLRLGHLAVVTEWRGPREIAVRHANWLNRGQIHLDTPVRDVSANNDWSAVRVWYTPGRTYGARTYAVSGFILPEQPEAKFALRQRPPNSAYP